MRVDEREGVVPGTQSVKTVTRIPGRRNEETTETNSSPFLGVVKVVQPTSGLETVKEQ